jgi:hypothetical protein
MCSGARLIRFDVLRRARTAVPDAQGARGAAGVARGRARSGRGEPLALPARHPARARLQRLCNGRAGHAGQPAALPPPPPAPPPAPRCCCCCHRRAPPLPRPPSASLPPPPPARRLYSRRRRRRAAPGRERGAGGALGAGAARPGAASPHASCAQTPRPARLRATHISQRAQRAACVSAQPRACAARADAQGGAGRQAGEELAALGVDVVSWGALRAVAQLARFHVRSPLAASAAPNGSKGTGLGAPGAGGAGGARRAGWGEGLLESQPHAQRRFELCAPFEPTGDQPAAIAALARGITPAPRRARAPVRSGGARESPPPPYCCPYPCHYCTHAARGSALSLGRGGGRWGGG